MNNVAKKVANIVATVVVCKITGKTMDKIYEVIENKVNGSKKG